MYRVCVGFNNLGHASGEPTIYVNAEQLPGYSDMRKWPLAAKHAEVSISAFCQSQCSFSMH